MKKIIIPILALLLVVNVRPCEGALKKLGQAGLKFLAVDLAARPAAMGGAFVTISSGADAMFYNPAGLAEMQQFRWDVFATRTNWIADISYNAGALAKNLGNLGTIGINFIGTDYGDDIIGTRVASTEEGYIETGTLDIGAYTVGVSYARSLTNKFKFGLQIKYAHQHLGENLISEAENKSVKNSVNGFGYDIGTIFYPGYKSFRFAMSIRNFSSQFKYEEEAFELPLMFRIGMAMDILDFLSGTDMHSFLLSIDALHPRDYTERMHIGGEYWYNDIIALRTGYKTNYDEEGLSFGFGLKYDISGVNLKVDYSYSQMGIFENVNRITIGGSF